MYKILKACNLASNIFLMEVEAKRVAAACEPGQFVIVKIDERGERIPLTICDYDRQKGTITIVVQTIGASTTRMQKLQAGDSFRDFVGPLGRPSEFVSEDIESLKKKKIHSAPRQPLRLVRLIHTHTPTPATAFGKGLPPLSHPEGPSLSWETLLGSLHTSSSGIKTDALIPTGSPCPVTAGCTKGGFSSPN